MTSLNPARVMLSISSWNRKLRTGSMRGAMAGLLTLRFGGVLEDAEDHEFRRPDRRDADLADEASVQDVVLRHDGLVAGDEKCLLLRASVKRAESPLRAQEDADRIGHPTPQAPIVRFEDNP